MKKLLSAAVFTAIVAVYAQGAGAVPAHNMTPYSLGIEYYGALHGHPVLYNFDTSSIASHFLRLHYSPCRFIRFSGGIGGASPQNNTHNIHGTPHKIDSKMGLSATGGAALVLPKLIPVLSITAGYEGMFLRYTEEETRIPIIPYGSDLPLDSVFIFGKTVGKMHTPYIGLILHPNRFVDFEIGGMYKIFDVRKSRNYNYWGWEYELDEEWKKSDSTWKYHPDYSYKANSDSIPMLKEIRKIEEIRIYGSMTISEPRSGAYLSFGASAAPNVDKEYKTNNWLTRSSVWLSAGAVIRDPRHGKKAKGEFSGSYPELKQRQNDMAQELLRDIDRELEQAEDEEEDEE